MVDVIFCPLGHSPESISYIHNDKILSRNVWYCLIDKREFVNHGYKSIWSDEETNKKV